MWVIATLLILNIFLIFVLFGNLIWHIVQLYMNNHWLVAIQTFHIVCGLKMAVTAEFVFLHWTLWGYE